MRPSNQLPKFLAAAALSGLLAGSAARVQAGTAGAPDSKAGQIAASNVTGKHDCKGKNACKGQGGCATSKNSCKGQNACKGQGGCATNGTA